MSPIVRSIQSEHAAQARAQRAHVYRDPRWRGPGGTRDRTLRRANHQCQWLLGCDAPATIADHFPLPLAKLIAQSGDPFDDRNTRALCHHHSGMADGGRS